MNSELELGIKYRADFVNEKLRGKTIKKLFGESSERVFVEFEDESQGMIEVLQENGDGRPFLSVMPPTDFSEAYREISRENVKGHAPDPENGETMQDPAPNPPHETDTKRGAGCSAPSCSCPSDQRTLERKSISFESLGVMGCGHSNFGHARLVDKKTGEVISNKYAVAFVDINMGYFLHRDMDRKPEIIYWPNPMIIQDTRQKSETNASDRDLHNPIQK